MKRENRGRVWGLWGWASWHVSSMPTAWVVLAPPTPRIPPLSPAAIQRLYSIDEWTLASPSGATGERKALTLLPFETCELDQNEWKATEHTSKDVNTE